MSDWMNDEWQDFVDVQRIDTDTMPPEALKLLKEAWLHGARAAIAVAKDLVDDHVATSERQSREMDSQAAASGSRQ